MAIILPGGFRITNNEPVDSRISIADQSARLGFSAANVYDGLVVFQQDNNTLYVLVDATNPSSDSSWEPIAQSSSTFPFTGSAGISGSLDVIGFTTLTGSLFIKSSGIGDPFVVHVEDGNGDNEKVKVNTEGVFTLGNLQTTPTAVTGGFIYSGSVFWLGFE